MNLSIIITYRPAAPIRKKHLDWTVKRYKKMFPTAELIISEDTTGKGWTDFQKGIYINKGVCFASKENLLITDIDVVLPKESILKGLELLEKYSLVTPYSILYKLNAGSSKRILSKKPWIALPKVSLKQQKKQVISKDHPQGIHMIKRKDFIKIKGYDERFVGWGSEDSAFQNAAGTLCGSIHRVQGIALHFKHGIVKNRQKKRDIGINGYWLPIYKKAYGNVAAMKEILKSRRDLTEDSKKFSGKGEKGVK